MWYDYENIDGLSDMIGKTMSEVYVVEDNSDGNQEIHFVAETGEHYLMYHSQDCCENVVIEDIDTDLDTLVGALITDAYEESNSSENEDYDSETWTFYRITSTKGTVCIRWHGSSNGYYSESVYVVKLKEENI